LYTPVLLRRGYIRLPMLIHSQKSLWPIAGNGIAYVLLRPFRLTAIIEPNRIEVDPILWTKKGHSLATLLPAFLTGHSWLLLLPRHACRIALSPGETEVGSAGEHPTKG